VKNNAKFTTNILFKKTTKNKGMKGENL